jgi:methyl-accepting chemotaxis protein
MRVPHIRSITGRLLILIGVSLIGLSTLTIASGLDVRNTMRDERRATMRSIVQSALTVAEDYEKQAQDGKLTREQAQTLTKAVWRVQRFERSGYLFAYTKDGTRTRRATSTSRT